MAANPPILHVFVTAVAKEIHRNAELDLSTIKKKKKTNQNTKLFIPPSVLHKAKVMKISRGFQE